MSVDTALERLRAANPVPDPSMLADRSDEVSVLLPVTWQRSTDMTQTIERPVHEEPPPSKKPRLLVALAAAAVAIVVGLAAIMVATTDGTDQTPVTQVTVTQAQIDDVPVTEAPEAEAMADDQAIALTEELIAMFNNGDVEGLAAALAAAASVEFGPDSEFDPMWANDVSELIAVHRALNDLGTNFLFENGTAPQSLLMLSEPGCRTVPASGARATVSCRGALDGGLFGGVEDWTRDGFVSVEIGPDGTVERFSMRFLTQIDSVPRTLESFFMWVEENHPEDLDVISVAVEETSIRPNIDYGRIPVFTEDGSPLLIQRLNEWRTAQG